MRALVLSSGGVDSTTALAMAVKKYGNDNVVSLAMYYGQKHDKELKASEAVAEYYKVEHIVLDLEKLFTYSDCALLKGSNKEIPSESYGEQLKKTNGSPVSTYVPFRNGLFISVAASIAISKKCNIIYYGAHADDSAGNAYPDCSPEFNKAISDAVFLGSGGELKIEAPFVNLNKADIVRKGLELNVPYELTWSCYQGGDKPCGICGTCIDRIRAFKLNGIDDPCMKEQD